MSIRELAYAGKTALCEIEADHLHNIPSVFNEANEARHHCYIVPERKQYLEKLKAHGDTEYLDERMALYEDPWKVLMTVARDELLSAGDSSGSSSGGGGGGGGTGGGESGEPAAG